MSFQSPVAKSAAVRVDFPDGSRKAYLSGLSRQGRPFTARLKPCPSFRDAFSISMLGACAPDDHCRAECAKAKAQANSLLILFGPT